MTAETPQFLDVGEGAARRRIAVLHDAGTAERTGLVWLSGFKSDMVSTKAAYLADWTRRHGHPMTRLDYSGHGQSEGRFEDGTIGRWLEEAEAVFHRFTRGPQVVIGSSMGGYIALLLARRLATAGQPLAGLVLIAPAWDMTEALMWRNFPAEARRAIAETGVFMRPSLYGDPYAITRGLIEEGRRHLLEGTIVEPRCAVRILQGMRDPDVPWRHALALVDMLAGDDVRIDLIKDGEHRLSRQGDLALLEAAVAELAHSPAR